MPEKFLAVADYHLVKGSKSLELKKEKIYSKKELVEFLESEGVLKFKLKCTKLKHALINFEEAKAVSIKEEKPVVEIENKEQSNSEIMFVVNKQVKKENKVVFKKSEKVKLSDLEGFDVADLVENGFLTEIKILEKTEAKD